MAKNLRVYIRTTHRYLGFFLAGIMIVYALSGITLIFRKTDFLKRDVQVEKQIETNLLPSELNDQLEIKGPKNFRKEGDTVYFKTGSYNEKTGIAKYTTKELPYLLQKITKLHKASTNDPLYWLNIFFGASLLFFALSSFWMFKPNTDIFKKGLYFTAFGLALTLILLFI
ncbi:MAG: hypothetical protein WD512_01320 [Candidatus Paceibacterota bacterium]